jgi:hypothetical protein
MKGHNDDELQSGVVSKVVIMYLSTTKGQNDGHRIQWRNTPCRQA